jgi:hypothetical protein
MLVFFLTIELIVYIVVRLAYEASPHHMTPPLPHHVIPSRDYLPTVIETSSSSDSK